MSSSKRTYENTSNNMNLKRHKSCKEDDTNSDKEERERKPLKFKNLCITCKIDMGDCNPRQLCGKTYCLFEDDCDFEDN